MSQSNYSGYSNLPNTAYSNPPKPGNNPWSAMGTLKCGACRDRRKKVLPQRFHLIFMQCEYDPNNLSASCYYCSQHGLSSCVKELAPVQKEFQQKHMQALSNSPSGGSRRVSDVALEYETAHPNATTAEVLSYVTGVIAPRQQQQQPQQPQQLQQPSFQYQAVPPSSTPNYWSPYYYTTTASSKLPRILLVK